MSEQIQFNEERRGYSKEEVNLYITMLQEALVKSEENAKKVVEDQENKLNEKEKSLGYYKESAESEKNAFKRYKVRAEQEAKELRERIQQEQQKSQALQKEKAALLEERKQDAEFQNGWEEQLRSKNETIQELTLMLDELKTAKSISEQNPEMDGLVLQIEELTKENENLKGQLQAKNLNETSVGTKGIEELFLQAKNSADAYVKDIQRQVQQEREQITKENEKLKEEAREEADRIIHEARAVKQEELDKKIADLDRIQREKMDEIDELFQNAKEELESAKVEAESIRSQANVVLEQAKLRRDKIMSRAQEKADQLGGPVREECERIKQELEDAGVRFAEMFRNMTIHDTGRD